MARGKKSGPSRMDMRRQAEAAEAQEKTVVEGEEEEVEEEIEAEEAESDADEGDGDEEGGKKKKKPKAKAVKKAKVATPKKPAVKRVRTPKETKLRAVWVVFDNSSKRVDTFPFSQKADAEALLAKKIEEKKGTFYMNMVKEAME